MARTDPTIYMRIPSDLKEALDAAAETNHRSLTAEVVSRLQASFDETPMWSKTFRWAAASAAGTDAIAAQKQEFLERMEKDRESEQIKDRVASLRAQTVDLDTQAITLARQLLRVQDELAQADARKDGKTVASLLKMRQELTVLLHRIDTQAITIKKSIDAAQAQLAQLDASDDEPDPPSDFPK